MQTNPKTTIDNYDRLLADFNLFLCEWFGHRNSAHYNSIACGRILAARTKDYNLYIRLWEYSNGVYGLPDRVVILVHTTYTRRQEQHFENLLHFLKAYAPLYGFDHIAIEGMVDYLDKTRYGFPQGNIASYSCLKITDLILPE